MSSQALCWSGTRRQWSSLNRGAATVRSASYAQGMTADKALVLGYTESRQLEVAANSQLALEPGKGTESSNCLLIHTTGQSGACTLWVIYELR